MSRGDTFLGTISIFLPFDSHLTLVLKRFTGIGEGFQVYLTEIVRCLYEELNPRNVREFNLLVNQDQIKIVDFRIELQDIVE